MNIKEFIVSFSPINSKEKIDQLIAELRKTPGAMNPQTRLEIWNELQKKKMQIYFNEAYPESLFNETPRWVNLQAKGNAQPTPVSKTVKQENTLMIDVPKETLGSKKYIYGTYIEMAFHNFFTNMQHIYALVFGEDIIAKAQVAFDSKNMNINPTYKPLQIDFANEDFVWKPMFDKFRNALGEERLKAEELFARHFPMLEAIKHYTTSNRKYKQIDTIGILECLSQTMRILRNVYSHYEIKLHPDQVSTYEGNEELVEGALQHAFLGSKRIVKERFAFDEQEMRCTEQYKFSFDSKTRKKVKEEIPGYRYKQTDKNKHLTSFGLVLLTSLFLEKKYSKILTDKLRMVPEKDQAVINELIAVYRVRLNTEKFHVTANTDALAFDILTELRKCPKELFELLKPEEQHKFRVKAGDEEEDSEDVLMMRHSDRFTHLVLKFIDDAKLFDNIRFQVSLGKYFFKFYNKNCIDNASEARVRSLCKNVNGFGRITEIDNTRMAVWDELIRKYDDVHKNSSSEKPYVTDHHPRYVVNGNRIAMHIFDDSCRSYIPELTTEGACNLAPSCWMSIYELPAMAFLIHLAGSSRVEEIIKITVAQYRKFFSDVAEGIVLPVDDEQALDDLLAANYAHIQRKDLPDDIVDYLLRKTAEAKDRFKQCADQLIDSLIEQTEYKIEQFREQLQLAANPKMNKLGKKSYVTIQPGKLASFLAKDMMYFQPNGPENKNKLTSLNYRILQATLALYNDTDSIKRTLESAHILGVHGDKMCNPIVMKIWQRRIHPATITDFYKFYLEERLAYLKECKHAQYNTLSFLHADRARWQLHDEAFYRAKAARYLCDANGGKSYDKAIELPRGLFDSAIREELLSMETMKQLAADKDKNISYLIYGYFKSVMLDDCSPIYDAERNYPLLNLLYRHSPRDPKVYFDIRKIRLALMKGKNESFQKAIEQHLLKMRPNEQKEERERALRQLKNLKDNETTLKRYKVQDIILFLIAKKILMADEKDLQRVAALNNIHLKDILDKDTLSQKVKFSVKVQSKNGYNKVITQADLKLKNYAQFYRILNDRRLPSLLDLIQTNHIERALIEEELSGYDKVHPHILENVFEYEKNYLESQGKSGTLDFPTMIEQDNNYSEEEQKSLKWIRNSFAHNSYPKFKRAMQQELPKKAVTIAETFIEKIKKKQ